MWSHLFDRLPPSLSAPASPSQCGPHFSLLAISSFFLFFVFANSSEQVTPTARSLYSWTEASTNVCQRLHTSTQRMVINCVIGISSLLVPRSAFPLLASPNELSPMIDFHISGMPTLTKRWLLEKLCHACGMEWAVKYRAGNSLARTLSSLTCNAHANRHTFSSMRGHEVRRTTQ